MAAAQEETTLVIGSYTFGKDEKVKIPNAFISENPAEDTIVFEENAMLDADVPFVFTSFEQWTDWHRETGADLSRMDEYELDALSTLTLGTAYNQITMAPGARIINRARYSDGLFALGPVSMELGQGAIVYGDWAGISFANFKDPEDSEYYEATIVNRGRIGSFRTPAPDGTGPFLDLYSGNGLLFYEGVGAEILNENTGIIAGHSFGVRTNYIERETIYIPLPGTAPEIDYIVGGRVNINNHGIIRGDSYDGIFEGGGLESINIVNHETGLIEGGRTGIMLSRGGNIDNRGAIRAGEAGILVSAGTANIIHSGRLGVFDEDGKLKGNADAIRFNSNAKGGTVSLYSGVDGAIRHLGDSSEAVLSLYRNEDNPSLKAAVGNIDFGEGVVTQYGGAWSYRDIIAKSFLLEGGEMISANKVEIEQNIDVESGALLTVTDGSITAENLFNDGTLAFNGGEIVIKGGEFAYTDGSVVADFNIMGSEEGRISHLRLSEGAHASGIDSLFIGGRYEGVLTLEDNAGMPLQGSLAVNSRGRLSGAGGVGGGTAVNNGGTIQPGYKENPTGTLSIGGDLDVARGAIVNIGIERGDENNAKIDVSGNANISGGTLKITDLSRRTVQDGDEYTFLTSELSRIGEFDAVESFSPIYVINLNYLPNSVSFKLERLANYMDFAETRNQKRYIEAVESAFADGHLDDLREQMDLLLEAVLREKTSPASLTDTINQLGPEPYQASFRMAADQSWQMNQRIFGGARTARLRVGTDNGQNGEQGLTAMLAGALVMAAGDRAFINQGDPFGMGLQMAGISANANNPENAAGSVRILPSGGGESIAGSGLRIFYGGYRRNGDVDDLPDRMGNEYRSRGAYLGVERSRERLNAGIGLAYANTEVDFINNSGDLNMHSLRIGPHATIARKNLEIDVALNGGAHFNRQKREMPILQRQSVVRYNVYDGTAYTSARYNLSFRDRWLLSPTAALQYTYQYRESIKERRAEDARLKLDSETTDILRSMVGLRLSRELSVRTAVLVPELFANYEYDLLDGDMKVSARFAEAPANREQVIRANAAGPDRETFVYGGKLTFLFGGFNAAFISYDVEKSDDNDVKTISAGVKWNF